PASAAGQHARELRQLGRPAAVRGAHEPGVRADAVPAAQLCAQGDARAGRHPGGGDHPPGAQPALPGGSPHRQGLLQPRDVGQSGYSTQSDGTPVAVSVFEATPGELQLLCLGKKVIPSCQIPLVHLTAHKYF
ncbi:unnamed protein product, partial [Ixodes pacificus]